MPSSARANLNELVGNQQIVQALWDAVNTSSGSLVNVPRLVNRLLKTGAWKEREVQQLGEVVRFDSFPAFIQTPPLRGCGWPLEKVEALIKDDPETLAMWEKAVRGKVGRPPEKADNIRNKRQYGTARGNLVARLKDEFPAIYARVIADELSAYAGAVEAGIRKPPPAITELRRAWKKATPEERAAFLAEIVQ